MIILNAAEQTELDAILASYQGSHAPEMRSVTERMVVILGFSINDADRIAKEASKDARAILKLAGNAKLSVGATSKKGILTIKEACSGKGSATPSLEIVHAIQWMAEAGKHGVAYGHTTWRLTERLEHYVKHGCLPEENE